MDFLGPEVPGQATGQEKCSNLTSLLRKGKTPRTGSRGGNRESKEAAFSGPGERWTLRLPVFIATAVN